MSRLPGDPASLGDPAVLPPCHLSRGSRALAVVKAVKYATQWRHSATCCGRRNQRWLGPGQEVFSWWTCSPRTWALSPRESQGGFVGGGVWAAFFQHVYWAHRCNAGDIHGRLTAHGVPAQRTWELLLGAEAWRDPHPPTGVCSALCHHFSEHALCRATSQLPNSASLRDPGRACLSPTNWFSGEVSGFGHWRDEFEELLLPLRKQPMPPLGLFLSPPKTGEQPFPPPSSQCAGFPGAGSSGPAWTLAVGIIVHIFRSQRWAYITLSNCSFWYFVNFWHLAVWPWMSYVASLSFSSLTVTRETFKPHCES